MKPVDFTPVSMSYSSELETSAMPDIISGNSLNDETTKALNEPFAPSPGIDANTRLNYILKGLDPDQALKSVLQILGLQPGNAPALYCIADFFRIRLDYQNMFIFLNRASSIHCDNQSFNRAIIALNLSEAIGALLTCNRIGIFENFLKKNFGMCKDKERILRETATIYYEIAESFLQKEEFGRAIEYYFKTLGIIPEHFSSLMSIARALHSLGRCFEVMRFLLLARTLRPDDGRVLCNLGIIYRDCGDFDSSLKYFHLALKNNPESPQPRWGRALTLLSNGDYRSGFEEYEWRWRVKELKTPRFRTSKPAWNGGDLSGKTLLLVAEQGYGDNIQFVRYAPIVRKKCLRLFYLTWNELVPLFGRISEFDRVFGPAEPAPDFDYYLPIMSLPRLLGIGMPSATNAYLFPDAGKSGHYGAYFSDNEPRVGVCLSGSGKHLRNSARTPGKQGLEALLRVSGISFYNLAIQGENLVCPDNSGNTFFDFTPEFTSFDETAAFIAHLDLVISIDTAVAHLAGAMGTPTWLMLPFAPDWRWGRSSSETPWYPSLRLFRQAAPNDWSSPLEAITANLQELKSNRPQSGLVPTRFQGRYGETFRN